MDILENKTFDELKIGDTARISRTLGERDIALFAAVSGDVNPAHLDPAFAETTRFHHVVAHGMWGGALISAVLGTELPGPGTVYVRQSLDFLRPAKPGDVLSVNVTVREKRAEGRRVAFAVEHHPA
ncbi:MAG: MaoC/PaaZ C-terminal domain-containing protein, partial [Pseudomonadota bacterium]